MKPNPEYIRNLLNVFEEFPAPTMDIHRTSNTLVSHTTMTNSISIFAC